MIPLRVALKNRLFVSRRHVAGIGGNGCNYYSYFNSTSPCVRFNNDKRLAAPTAVSRSTTGITRPTFQSIGTTSGLSNAAHDNDTTIPFLLADIGEGIAEVELLQWHVQVGDSISQFDPLCQVQSDKATVDITSRYRGTVVSLQGQAGDIIAVGSPLMYIAIDDVGEAAVSTSASDETKGQEETMPLKPPPSSSLQEDTISENNTTPPPTAVESTDAAPPVQHEETPTRHEISDSTILTTPAVRKLAKDHGINLATISGTGPNGRILKADVLSWIEQNNADATADVVDADLAGVSSQTLSSQDNFTLLPMKGYNRIMFQTMTQALQIPHMVFSDELDVTSLTRFVKDIPQQNDHAKISILVLCIKALSMALTKHPLMNSQIVVNENQIKVLHDHNIGIAMDTPRGLVVPVIKYCQNKSLQDIADELQRLKDSSESLSSEDLSDATISLSNVGALGCGGTYMSPVVTPPQVAIGALGSLQRVPRFVEKHDGMYNIDNLSNAIEERLVMNVSWSADHRIIDGASLARFHRQFKQYMESPTTAMLLDMK